MILFLIVWLIVWMVVAGFELDNCETGLGIIMAFLITAALFFVAWIAAKFFA